LPYRFVEHGVQVRIEGCGFDGLRDAAIVADHDRHVLDVSARRFERVTLDLAASVTPQLLEEVLRPDERTSPPIRVLALVRCPATHLRTTVELTATRSEPATYTCRVAAARVDLAATLGITVMLVRASSAQSRADGWASRAGERLASARTWEVRIDANQQPGGHYLDMRQEDFRLSGAHRFPVPEALYQLDLDGEAPTLWLNSGHPRILHVLHSAGTVGKTARLRDAFFDRISAAVWIRLIMRAARDLVRLDEPAAPWQTAVLQKWLPFLYPHIADQSARLDATKEELEDGGEESFLQRLDLVLQRELETVRALDMLAEELEP
jgi:hypothetical protein